MLLNNLILIIEIIVIMNNEKTIGKSSSLQFDWTKNLSESQEQTSDEEIRNPIELIQIHNAIQK